MADLYDGLPFKSKPNEWWETNFMREYTIWCQTASVRNLDDASFIMIDVKIMLVEDYPHLNEKCVLEAIRDSFRDPVRVEHYGRLDRAYLSPLIAKYDKKIKDAHSRMMKIVDSIDPPPPNEAQKREIMIAGVRGIFNSYKSGEMSWKDFTPAIYTFLSGEKYITLSREQMDIIMTDAHLEARAWAAQNEKPTELQAILSKITPNSDPVKNFARRIAVRDYFDSIEKLPF